MRGASHDRAPDADARRADAAAIARIRDGDERAFDELYRRWFDRVHHLVRSIVADPDGALDATQDAFTRAWRSLDRLDDPHAFGGWMLRIARNAGIDQTNRARRAPVVDEAIVISTIDVEAAMAAEDQPMASAVRAEERAVIESVCASLGERDRTALMLQAQYDLTPAEIGAALDLSRDAANQLVHRARERFAGRFALRLLWRGDEPACDELKRLVGTPSAFDERTAAIAARHAPKCDVCDDRRKVRAAPMVWLPLVAIPHFDLERATVARRLHADGVPVRVGASTGRRVAVVLAAVAALVLLGVGVGVVAGRADPQSGEAGPSAATVVATSDTTVVTNTTTSSTSTTSTTATTSTTTTVAPESTVAGAAVAAPSTEVPAAAPPATARPPRVAPPPAPTVPPTTVVPEPPPATTPTTVAPPPPTTVPPVIVAAVTPPSTTLLTWRVGSPQQPRLTWSMSGGSTVSINGPNLSSAERSGDVGLCPGTIAADGQTCVVTPGVYTYRASIRADDGTLIARRQVTLSIG